jgi:hypothetical protein
MNTVFPGSLTSGKHGGIRDRIERRSRAAIDGGQVVAGDTKPSTEDTPGPVE